jgi:hypothetical protein
MLLQLVALNDLQVDCGGWLTDAFPAPKTSYER